jgi:hypothetical protein
MYDVPGIQIYENQKDQLKLHSINSKRKVENFKKEHKREISLLI